MHHQELPIIGIDQGKVSNASSTSSDETRAWVIGMSASFLSFIPSASIATSAPVHSMASDALPQRLGADLSSLVDVIPGSVPEQRLARGCRTARTIKEHQELRRAMLTTSPSSAQSFLKQYQEQHNVTLSMIRNYLAILGTTASNTRKYSNKSQELHQTVPKFTSSSTTNQT